MSKYDKTIKSVLKQYDLGNFKESSLMKGGFANINYKIKTTKGTYFFREYKYYPSVQSVRTVLGFLLNAKFATAKPIKSKQGKLVVVILHWVFRKRVFAIFEFVTGPTIDYEKSLKVENEEEKKLWLLYEERELNAARILAKLHNETADIPPRDRLIFGCYYDKPLKQIKKRIIAAKNNSRYDRMLLKYRKDVLHFISLYERLLHEVPRKEHDTIIHGDFWTNQIIFDGPKVAALIDFDAVYFGVAAYDLIKGMHSFVSTWNSVGDPFSFEKIEKFLDAYAEVAKKPLDIRPNELLLYLIHGTLDSLTYFVCKIGEKNMSLVEEQCKGKIIKLKWFEKNEKKVEKLFHECDKKIKEKNN